MPHALRKRAVNGAEKEQGAVRSKNAMLKEDMKWNAQTAL